MALSFAFGGKGVDKITPDELKERRRTEEALQMALLRPAQNVGEGLSAIGQALLLRRMRGKNDASARYAQDEGNRVWSELLGGMGGGSAPASPGVSAMTTPTSAPSATGVDVARALQKDFGLSPGAAAGVAGNLAHESGDFKTLQEINPTVAGSRGGYGWAQWTGPRRRAYEGWAKQQGLDPSSPEANYGFLSHELRNTPESSVISALQGVTDPAQAAEIFSNKFLRPGIPHMGSRVSKASAIAQALGQGGQQQPVQVASLDPQSGWDAFNKPVLAPNGPQGVVQGRDITPQADMHGNVPMPAPQQAQAAPQAAPVQVAQAQPQGGNDRLYKLMQAAQNPYLSDEQRGIVGIMLKQEMERNQPLSQLDQLQLEKTKLELEQAKGPQWKVMAGKDGSMFRVDERSGKMEQIYGGKPDTYTPLTDEEEVKLGLDPAGAYQRGADNKISKIGGDGTTVNIDQKTEGAFEKKAAEKQAETFDTMASEGLNARADLGIIGELEGLLKGQGGVGTGVAGWLAQRGIGGEGMGDLQATQALINKLVPTQRQAGSGSMSDRDVELFTRSLPSLWNQPGGNEKIINVMRGLAQYKASQGEIADQVLNGEITRQEGRKLLRALPNPLADFKAPEAAKSGAKKSTEIDGYTIEEVD